MHLLERQEQVEELNRCLHEARAGCGKLVLVAGGAGLGKSALVERFVSEHRRDARALWGACDGLSTPQALAPVHEIAAQSSGLAGRTTRDDESRDWLFRALLEDWTEAAHMASELLRSSEVTGAAQRVTVLTTLALVRIRRGDPGADELLDEALELAVPTGEVSRIARVPAARAEQAWYCGKLADVASETAIGLAHVRDHMTPWLNGELLSWQSRAV